MNTTTNAIQFRVADVESATVPLPEISSRNAIRDFADHRVEACGSRHDTLLTNVCSAPIIATLHAAFCKHRPVVLSPDTVWLVLLQGFAIHANRNASILRERLVSHSGKLKICVRRDDFVKGNKHNPWPEVFSEFSLRVGEHLEDTHKLVLADFSTTGSVEKAASEIALLDTVQAYFEYELRTICGIPSIALEGTVDDWKSIASRLDALGEFELEWWTKPLKPILRQFVLAAGGDVDREFWNSMYKYMGADGSGTPYVSGWIKTFFPYLSGGDGAFQHNPYLQWMDDEQGPTREQIPHTCAKAPFKWLYLGATYPMDLLGGLIGVSQCPETLALRPEVGWAVLDRSHQNPQRKNQASIDPYSRREIW